MKQTLLLYLFFALACADAFSNASKGSYRKTFRDNGDFVDAEITQDSGFIALGYDSYTGDYGLIKLNENGVTEWTLGFESPESFNIKKVTQNSLGDYFVMGDVTFNSKGQIYVLKVDAKGTMLDIKTIYYSSTNSVWDIEIDDSGGALLVGGGCNGHNYVVHFDKNLNILWQKVYNVLKSATATAIMRNSKGNFVIGGYATNFVKNSVQLFEIDINGNLIWSHVYNSAKGSSDNTFVKNISQTADGGYLLSGYSKFFNSSEGSDLMIIRTNAVGSVQWAKYFSYDWELAHDAIELQDKSILVGGTSTFSPEGNPFFAKLDSNGKTVFVKEIVDQYYGAICSIIPLCDNKVAIFGGSKMALSFVNTSGTGICAEKLIDKSRYIDLDTTFTSSTSQLAEQGVTFLEGTFNIQSVTFTTVEKFQCNDIVNNTCKFSATAVEKENSLTGKVEVYPNPGTDEVNILVYESLINSQYQIVNLQGQVVMQGKIQSTSQKINIEQLVPAMYYLCIGNQATMVIVKQ